MMFFDRCYIDLFNGADLLLLHNIQSRHIRTDHRDQHRQNTRYHEKIIIHERIVPVSSNYFNSWPRTETFLTHPLHPDLTVMFTDNLCQITAADLRLGSID